jgi:hypothetical protein
MIIRSPDNALRTATPQKAVATRKDEIMKTQSSTLNNAPVAFGGQGIMAPTSSQMRAAIKSAVDSQPGTPLDRANPADLRLIQAFEALQKKYNLTSKGDRDHTRTAGVLADDTIVVKEIGYSGIPMYSSAGKLKTRW